MTLGIMLISFPCGVSQQDMRFSLFISAYLFHLQVGTGFSFTDHVHGYAIDRFSHPPGNFLDVQDRAAS